MVKRNVVYVVAITNLYATITLTIITVNYNSNNVTMYLQVYVGPNNSKQHITHYTLHIYYLLATKKRIDGLKNDGE